MAQPTSRGGLCGAITYWTQQPNEKCQQTMLGDSYDDNLILLPATMRVRYCRVYFVDSVRGAEGALDRRICGVGPYCLIIA